MFLCDCCSLRARHNCFCQILHDWFILWTLTAVLYADIHNVLTNMDVPANLHMNKVCHTKNM